MERPNDGRTERRGVRTKEATRWEEEAYAFCARARSTAAAAKCTKERDDDGRRRRHASQFRARDRGGKVPECDYEVS